jgi:hypothetical protein
LFFFGSKASSATFFRRYAKTRSKQPFFFQNFKIFLKNPPPPAFFLAPAFFSPLFDFFPRPRPFEYGSAAPRKFCLFISSQTIDKPLAKVVSAPILRFLSFLLFGATVFHDKISKSG